jgi:hypothetical protein
MLSVNRESKNYKKGAGEATVKPHERQTRERTDPETQARIQKPWVGLEKLGEDLW